MANASILAAFERMWQHVVLALNDKSDATLAAAKEYADTQVTNTLNVTDGVAYFDAGIITDEGDGSSG